MTNPAPPAAACRDAETLAAFAEGRLPRGEAAALIEHIAECEDCIAVLESVNETIATRNVATFPRRRSWWIAVAAALVIGVIGLTVFRERIASGPSSSLARLIELAPRSARPVEPRLSGGFVWAAYRGPMRASEGDADPQRMRLIGTAGEIVAEADRDRGGDAQRAAGVALLVIDKPAQAIERLRAAVQASPNDAVAWSDLAAAQYAAALHSARPSLLPEALVSADRALRLDSGLAEARFNRALVLERLGLTSEAKRAWQNYLAIDSASPWAREARERLAKLEPASAVPQSDAQRARTFAEAETLGRWAEAVKSGDEAGAQRELGNARTTADSLLRTTGESLLHEAVQAIDVANPSARAALADAHSVYRRGRIAYSRGQLDSARADLAGAVPLFERGRSPMSLVARYYAACARFDQHEVADARAALQTLLGEVDSHPHFMALGAQVRWELALSFMVDGDWSGAVPLLESARASFQRLGERNHLGSIESMLADTQLSLGRPDEAWAARIRAFALLSTHGSGDRLPVSMIAAAQMEARSGRLATARALLDVARTAAHPIANDGVAADVLIHAALMNAAAGDSQEAARRIGEAAAAVDRIGDASTREIARTNLDVAGAYTVLQSDPQRAKEMLTRAIDAYGASGRTVFLPECYLLRARASLRRGEFAAADGDLESGIVVLERSRIRTGAVVGTGVLNAGVALFEEAIRRSADRKDLGSVFLYAERSRAQLAFDEDAQRIGVRELQQNLGASDAAVLQVIVLPEELVTICVTPNNAVMKRHRADREAIERLAAQSTRIDENTQSLAALYDLVIRPIEPLLTESRQLIVIADHPLQTVPFAALYDASTHRYLVQRMAVSMALSASTLEPLAGGPATDSVLAVALPSGASNAGLPESAREIADVTASYPRAVAMAQERATFAAFAEAAPSASVIHIAGHTQRQSDDTGTALVFARERVTWSTIAVRRLPRAPVVVLAACETLQQRATANVRALTLGAGFLAAGAGVVIGTLTPIADAEARELFSSIHRHLAAGALPSEAVRTAQLEALARRSDSWRAVALLTRCLYRNA